MSKITVTKVVVLLLASVAVVAAQEAVCSSFLDCKSCFEASLSCSWCSKGAVGCYDPLVEGVPSSCESELDWDNVIVIDSDGDSVISPDSLNGTLIRSGNSADVNFTVTIPALVPQILHLQDLSGSFGDDISNIRSYTTGLPAVLTELQADISPHSSIGVTSFDDQPDWYGRKAFSGTTKVNGVPMLQIGRMGSSGSNDCVYEHIGNFTDSVGDLSTTLNSLSIKWGADFPEDCLSAMAHSLDTVTTGWRGDSVRIFTIATDAPFHTAGDYLGTGRLGPTSLKKATDLYGAATDKTEHDPSSRPPTVAELGAKLIKNNVVPVFLLATDYYTSYTTGEYHGETELWYQEMIDFWGRGSIVHLGSSSGNLATAIVDISKELQGTLDVSISSSNPHFVVTGSLDNDTWDSEGNPGSINIEVLPSIFTAADTDLSTNITISVVGTSYSKVYTVGAIQGCDCEEEEVDTCDNGGESATTCGVCPCPDFIAPACLCYLEGASPCSETNTESVDCDTCVCKDGWEGDDCTCSTICPAPETTDGVVSFCSGNGDCDCGTCDCHDGWGGDDCSCSTAECPDDCNGQGECVCGACECTEGWSGDSCDVDSFSCSNFESCEDCSVVPLCGWCYDSSLTGKTSSCERLSDKGAEDSSVCPTEAPNLVSATCVVDISASSVVVITSSVVGAAGIGAAILAKLVIKSREKKEWDAFKGSSHSQLTANPIYENTQNESYNKMRQ